MFIYTGGQRKPALEVKHVAVLLILLLLDAETVKMHFHDVHCSTWIELPKCNSRNNLRFLEANEHPPDPCLQTTHRMFLLECAKCARSVSLAAVACSVGIGCHALLSTTRTQCVLLVRATVDVVTTLSS